jgi:hypothetical protein
LGQLRKPTVFGELKQKKELDELIKHRNITNYGTAMSKEWQKEDYPK